MLKPAAYCWWKLLFTDWRRKKRVSDNCHHELSSLIGPLIVVVSWCDWCRGPSASPLCFIIIACHPRHESFNHRQSSFTSPRFPSGTLCRKTPRRRHHWLFSGNTWRLISSIVPSPNSSTVRAVLRHFCRYNWSFCFLYPADNYFGFFVHSCYEPRSLIRLW